MNEITQSTMSFDRMRTMLVRAAEIRESEQQQIFDALDEIHGRLAPLEAIGSMRKRLADIPDRNEVGALAERLDETITKLDANDAAVSSLTRAVDAIVDKLAKPFAQLDGRLDGVAGRFEGVAGRMDGLEDKLSSIHRRLDELELHLDKQDTRIESMPRELGSIVRERLETVEASLSNKLSDTETAVQLQVESMSTSLAEVRSELGTTTSELTGKISATTEEVQGAIAETTDVLHGKLAENAAADGGRFDSLHERIEQIGATMDSLNSRLDGVESDLSGKVGTLSDDMRAELNTVRETVVARPDAEAVDSLVRKANAESEQRNAGQLDEAMATFAELILGGGSPNMASGPALPKQQVRRRAKARTNGAPTAGGEGEKDTAEETV